MSVRTPNRGERKPEQWFTGRPFEALAALDFVVIESAPSSPYSRIYRTVFK